MHTLSLASTLRLVGGLALITAATSAACSAVNTTNTFTSGSGGNNSGAGGSGNGNGSAGSGGEDGFDAGATSDGSVTDANACAAESTKAEQLPLDMYIMLDQSGSMSDPVAGGATRWAAVTSAFKTFVNQPGAADIGVGIQYFP
ncbi:MAG: hypothetical protein ABI134_15015, partial [Byssovorax sp.]